MLFRYFSLASQKTSRRRSFASSLTKSVMLATRPLAKETRLTSDDREVLFPHWVHSISWSHDDIERRQRIAPFDFPCLSWHIYTLTEIDEKLYISILDRPQNELNQDFT